MASGKRPSHVPGIALASLSPRFGLQWTLARCTPAMATHAHILTNTRWPLAPPGPRLLVWWGPPCCRAEGQTPDRAPTTTGCPKGEGPQEKPPHLGPFQDAVQAEVVGAALRRPHSLVPESVETDGATLGLVIRVKRTPGLQGPLSACDSFHIVVVIIFRFLGTLRKG